MVLILMGMCTSMQCKYMIILLITHILVSCNRGNAIEKEIQILKSKPIEFVKDSLFCISENDLDAFRSYDYMFLTFLDSTECTVCQITHMYPWENLADTYLAIPFVFIFEKEKNDMQGILSESPIAALNVFLYCDTIGYFRRHNIISNNDLLHTYLLDAQGNIVLVGNPANNSNVRKIVETILQDKSILKE